MTDPSSDRGGLWRVLAAMLATQALVTWAALALAAIAPTVAASFDLPPVLIGYQIAIVYLIATGTSLVAGAMVIRWGAGSVSQYALAACAIGCVLATVPHLATLALASGIIGFAYGLTNPAAAHLLARHTTARNRSLVFSIKQTGVPVGGVLAGLVTPWAALAWGWQGAVALIAPVALALILALAPAREGWDADRNRKARIGVDALAGGGAVLTRPAFRWLCFCAFCFGAIQLSLLTFVATFAITELAFGAILGGSLLATVQAFGVAGRLGWGFLADRLQSNGGVLMIIGAVTGVCCATFALLGPETPRWFVFAVSALFGASAVGWNGVFLAEAVRLSPAGMAGTATGIATFAAFSGVLAGPAIFVQLHGWLGSYTQVYGLLLLPALIGIVGAGLTIRHGRTVPREDAAR